MGIRYTRQEQQALIEEQRRSGLSKTDFCKEKGIRKLQFYRWISCNKKISLPKKSNFVPVKVISSQSVQQANTVVDFSKTISIHISNSIKIEVTEKISPQWLGQVLKAVSQ